MKKVILMFLIFISNIYSQDKEPNKLIFHINGKDTTLSKELVDGGAKKFIIGTQWGGLPIVHDALLMNMQQNQFLTRHWWNNEFGAFGNEYKTTADSSKILAIGFPTDVFLDGSMSFQYEPTLKTDSLNNYQPREYDSTNPIFGFKQIDTTNFGYITPDVSDSANNTNYGRYQLRKNNSFGNIDSIVLSKPLVNSYLTRLIDTVSHTNPTLVNWGYAGTNFYVTINLRRAEWDSSNTNLDDTVLTIKMPYKNDRAYKGDSANYSGYMKFDSIPDTSKFHINYNGDRGYALNLKPNSSSDRTKFVITKRMLPKSNEANKDITISAHFLCNNDIEYNNKPLINEFLHNYLETDIKQTEIEVHYHNKMSVNIDWVRIENGCARRILRGGKDLDDNLGWSYKTSINDFIKYCDTSKSYKFYRLYANGGHDGKIIWHWGTIRYVNLLTGGLMTSSMPLFSEINHQSFLDYTKIEDSWTAHNAFRGVSGHELAKPYYKPLNDGLGADNTKTIGFKSQYGYKNNSLHRDSITHQSDSLNSFYETSMFSKRVGADPIPGLTIKAVKDSNSYNQLIDICQYSAAPLVSQEYYNDFNNINPSYLYADKPWWGQIFVTSEWQRVKANALDSFPKYAISDWHPLTGEEVSYLISKNLILGAKGLCYDREGSENRMKTFNPNEPQLNSDNSINNKESFQGFTWYNYKPTHSIDQILNTDSSGGDFLDRNNDGMDLIKWLDTNSVKTKLIPSLERVYLGYKSMQKTAFRLHSFIRNNESFLMGLKLQCYYGQGFFRRYHQNPSYTQANIINNYIRTDSIKTRKLFQPNPDGTYSIQYSYEDKDSAFYDLTLLKNDTNSMQKNFIIGLQNRRCDPLIINLNTNNSSQHEVQFNSSAEFEKAVQQDSTNDLFGIRHHKSWWKELYWKKFGIRNITIPFNFKLQSDTNKYCLLHVKELYDTSSYAVSLRNATNTKLIDTIIGQDSPLAITLQPGQGTFLKCDVLEPQKNIVGELDYSNQNKMVIWKDSAVGNTFSYHIAFYKKDTIVKSGRSIPLNRIYYARSKTFKGQMDLANIDWYDIKPISNNITDRETNVIDTFDCAYPSIIVRKDTNNLAKAYIVYQCRDTNITSGDYKQGRIVETILDVTGTYTSSVVSSKEIAMFYFSSLDKYEDYGNPVINASKDGNFYAWSSLDGIISGFKKPNTSYFDDSLNDTIAYWIAGAHVDDEGSLQHPSLNPYSIIFDSNGKNENQASLVFQGTPNFDYNRYIYFTRLKVDNPNSKVKHFQAPYMYDTSVYPQGLAFKLLDSNRVAKFLWGGRTGALPNVYRALDHYLKRYEVIAWERRYDTLNSQIFALNILDRYLDPDSDSVSSWSVKTYARVSPITGNNMDVGKPTLGNPTEIDRADYFNPKVRGEAVLNFTWGDKIYHTPLDRNSIITTSGSFLSEDSIAGKIKYVAKGMLPHLMNSPYEIALPDIWQNRRIYNTLDTVHHITSSARYYYFKKNDVGDEISACYGFANDSTFLIMTKAKLNGSDLPIKLPYATVDSVFSVINSDTLYSSWFNVGSSAQLSFVYKGSDLTKNACYIQRADTNLKYNLTLTQTNDTIYNLVNYNMINGNNHDYRLVIQRLDSNSRYNEEILLGDLHYNDTLFFKSNNRFDSKTIDLATYKETFSKIFPNPSDGKINLLLAIDYDKDNKIILLISDITGQVIKELTTDFKDQIKLDMSNVTNGSYILQIKGYKHDKPTTETLQFKINK